MRRCALGLLLLVGACGTGRLTVLEPPVDGPRLRGVQLREGNHAVPVPEQERAELREILASHFERRHVADGGKLTVEYRLTAVDKGDRFTRWLWGPFGDAGEGFLIVGATFLGPGGRRLGRVRVEANVRSGAFGGPFSDAMHRVAHRIAGYAVEHFLDAPKR